MAKSKLSEKITNTHQLSVEGTLNVDDLGKIIVELEDEGEKDISDIIRKFNGEYMKLVITKKDEEIPSEEGDK